MPEAPLGEDFEERVAVYDLSGLPISLQIGTSISSASFEDISIGDLLLLELDEDGQLCAVTIWRYEELPLPEPEKE